MPKDYYCIKLSCRNS
uniref:Uncharacterized protein n=1 Tax=Arundo donax TaxID=35708 RepID=A0A0A8YJR9_ARUDO